MEETTKAPASAFEWDFINDLSAFTGDENSIIELLLHRLEREQIYTWVGPLLLALNPGKDVNDLYEESQRKLFTIEANIRKEPTPHIYAVANRALYRLVNGLGKICQVIVISGESGTGKTFNARKALDFLAATNEISCNSGTRSQAGSCEEIVHKIGHVFPLVSSFSTASTSRNAKSSRHGQLLRLQYDDNGAIRGACIHSFLLERTRVTACSDNFEIFYQLVFGLSNQEIDELLLSRDENYTMLGDYERSRDTRFFVDGFSETVDSMKTLGFKEEWKNDIFRIIAFIVHMGNIRFRQKTGEGCTIDLVDDGSRKALKNACSLISLPEYELVELLTSTLICPQNSHTRKRHTSYRRELKTPEDCRNRLFSIARYIYDRLFNWLVDRVNESLCVNEENFNWLGNEKFLNVNFKQKLKIFEWHYVKVKSFESNGLEQLCINYATERLQLYFMEDYLEAGLKELEEEGLAELSPSLAIQIYRDRLFVIEEIVFSTLNDSCQSPIPPKLSILRHQLLTKQKDSRFLKIKNEAFVIEHYSCPVEYNVYNLLSKNTDKVPTELSSTFRKCDNKLLRILSEIEEDNAKKSRVSLKKCTALAKLKSSLDCLVKELNKCDSHYVRCARPRHINDSWAKSEFREQLAGTGIFDALPLARCKLPVKFQLDEFYKRYSINQTDSVSDLARYLSRIVNFKDLTDSIHLGKRFVFLNEAIFFDLENYRKNHRSQCAKKIESFWMRARQRRRTKDPARLSIEEVDEPTGSSNEMSLIMSQCENPLAEKLKLAQEDQENNNFSGEEFSGNKNVSDLTSFEMKTSTNFHVPSADTGYSTQTIGDESLLAESQRPSDISTCPSREELPIDGKLMETGKLKQLSGIDVWKHFYVRNWLEVNPSHSEEDSFLYSTRELKYQRNIELPEDTTFLMNLNKCPLFYRNRILSRQRPVEIPIRFHTRLTCLAHSHRLPASLRPRGLEDCLAEGVNSLVDY